MLIFARQATLANGQQLAGTTFAVEIAAQASAITGAPISVYQSVFGLPLGTILWTERLESQAEFGAQTAKLMANAAYVSAVDKAGQLFAPGAEDLLINVVSTSLNAPKPIVITTTATLANGKFEQSMEFGVTVQQHLAKTTGFGTTFATDVFGTYGGVRWMTGVDTMAEVDTFQQALGTDTALLALISSAAELFVPGSGRNGLLRRIN